MGKLIDDPKVAELVSKAELKAIKAENKRVVEIIKSNLASAKENDDKNHIKIVTGALKGVLTDIKQAA